MLKTIKKWLGLVALKSEIDRLVKENEALRSGEAVVTPDGKVAKAEPLPKLPLRPRINSFPRYARQREARAWRDLCQEAYPNVGQPKD